jgi:hypothetical protein
MSPHAFSIVLMCGSALLALWIIARYTEFGPRSIVGAIIHVIAAMVLLMLVLPPALDALGASGFPARLYVQMFGVALPMLVYAFLSGGWVARLALGMLR